MRVTVCLLGLLLKLLNWNKEYPLRSQPPSGPRLFHRRKTSRSAATNKPYLCAPYFQRHVSTVTQTQLLFCADNNVTAPVYVCLLCSVSMEKRPRRISSSYKNHSVHKPAGLINLAPMRIIFLMLSL